MKFLDRVPNMYIYPCTARYIDQMFPFWAGDLRRISLLIYKLKWKESTKVSYKLSSLIGALVHKLFSLIGKVLLKAGRY